MASIIANSGCSLIGGPGDADVQEVAKKELIKMAGPSVKDWPEIISHGKFNNKGCQTGARVPGAYACAVDVTLNLPGKGEVTNELPVALVKRANGDWVSIDDCNPDADTAAAC